MKVEQEALNAPTADGSRVALKERLTGAVILVVLVVLLVPALLTGRRPEPPAAGTSTSGQSRSYEIDLVGPRRPAPEDPDQPLPEPESAPAPQRLPAPAAVARPAAASGSPEAPVRVAPTGVPRLPTAVPSGAAGSAVAPRQASAPREARAPGEAHRSLPASDDRAPGSSAPVVSAAATPSPGPGGGTVKPAPPTAWAVQLGAFAGRDTAARLVASLRARGFAAFMLEYRRDGKVLYRVRVGPEQDRERALAIAARLNREGYRASVAPHP